MSYFNSNKARMANKASKHFHMSMSAYHKASNNPLNVRLKTKYKKQTKQFNKFNNKFDNAR